MSKVVHQESPVSHAHIVCLVEDGELKPSDTPRRHGDFAAATREAERLAAKYRGKRFTVLRAASQVAVADKSELEKAEDRIKELQQELAKRDREISRLNGELDCINAAHKTVASELRKYGKTVARIYAAALVAPSMPAQRQIDIINATKDATLYLMLGVGGDGPDPFAKRGIRI